MLVADQRRWAVRGVEVTVQTMRLGPQNMRRSDNTPKAQRRVCRNHRFVLAAIRKVERGESATKLGLPSFLSPPSAEGLAIFAPSLVRSQKGPPSQEGGFSPW